MTISKEAEEALKRVRREQQELTDRIVRGLNGNTNKQPPTPERGDE